MDLGGWIQMDPAPFRVRDLTPFGDGVPSGSASCQSDRCSLTQPVEIVLWRASHLTVVVEYLLVT